MYKKKKIGLILIIFIIVEISNIYAQSMDLIISEIAPKIQYGDVLFGIPYHNEYNEAATILTYYLIEATRKEIQFSQNNLNLNTGVICSLNRMLLKYIDFKVNDRSYDYTYFFSKSQNNMYKYKSYSQESYKNYSNKEFMNKIYNWLNFMKTDVYKYPDAGEERNYLSVKDFWQNYIKQYDRQALIITGKMKITKINYNRYRVVTNFDMCFTDGYIKQKFPDYPSQIDLDNIPAIEISVRKNVASFFSLIQAYLKE